MFRFVAQFWIGSEFAQNNFRILFFVSEIGLQICSYDMNNQSVLFLFRGTCRMSGVSCLKRWRIALKNILCCLWPVHLWGYNCRLGNDLKTECGRRKDEFSALSIHPISVLECSPVYFSFTRQQYFLTHTFYGQAIIVPNPTAFQPCHYSTDLYLTHLWIVYI